MTARSLLLGLDGADVSVIQRLGANRLPHLHRAMQVGAWSRIEALIPFATLPNWTTILTGADPGAHGVFDFTTRRDYGVAFTAGTIREVPTIISELDRSGYACGCVGFPGTWPPERLRHGVFISGWDSPVAFEADRSFMWPPSFYDAIVKRFGPPRFDEVDEFDAERPGWHAELADALVEKIRRKIEYAKWLLTLREWDLFAFYFGESDTAAHHLWALFDEHSPRHPVHTTPLEAEGLAKVYEELDRAVGELLAAAGGASVELTLISDHGSGGASDKVLYLNRLLEAGGFLNFRPERASSPWLGKLKDIALTRLPGRVRQTLFHAAGRVLPGWLESRNRFGAIEMAQTQAFSDELNYFPAIHLNLAGRESLGLVLPEAREALVQRLRAYLLGVRDPWTNEPVVTRVWNREALYSGEFLERAPDLILELALDSGYSYNLMPSSSAPSRDEIWRRLTPDEYLGRKGRSLPGSHRPHGLFVMAGPNVRAAGEIRASMFDVSPNLLSRMGVRPSATMRGRVCREALRRNQRTSLAAPVQHVQSRTSKRSGEGVLERRLRALGYVD